MHTTSETSSKDGNKAEAAQKVDNLPQSTNQISGIKKNFTSPNMLEFGQKKKIKSTPLHARLESDPSANESEELFSDGNKLSIATSYVQRQT